MPVQRGEASRLGCSELSGYTSTPSDKLGWTCRRMAVSLQPHLVSVHFVELDLAGLVFCYRALVNADTVSPFVPRTVSLNLYQTLYSMSSVQLMFRNKMMTVDHDSKCTSEQFAISSKDENLPLILAFED